MSKKNCKEKNTFCFITLTLFNVPDKIDMSIAAIIFCLFGPENFIKNFCDLKWWNFFGLKKVEDEFSFACLILFMYLFIWPIERIIKNIWEYHTKIR